METIILKEGSKNGNTGYIEVYDLNNRKINDIVRGVDTLNKYFNSIDGKVKTIINKTYYLFPKNMPYKFEIIKL